MKNFNMWWLMEAQNIVGVGRAQEVNVAQETWKAALQWALSTRGKDKYGQIVNNVQVSVIEKELDATE